MSTPTWFRKIANISDGNALRERIKRWINPQDKDDIVAIQYQYNRWTYFSNNVFPGQELTPTVDLSLAYDPPGEFERPGRHRSIQTTFDQQPFSSRSEAYRTGAVEYFAEMTINLFLRRRHYVIEPTVEVREALGGRLPGSLEDLAQVLQYDPALLRHVSYAETAFDQGAISDPARQIIAALLENEDTLADYLQQPADFVGRVAKGSYVPEEEVDALINAARQAPEVVRSAFDHIALGESTLGDGDVYILIGLDRELGIPNLEGLEWLRGELPGFVEQYHFAPNVGWYVTEAQLCYTVVAGPGVIPQEIDFLQAEGSDVIDRTHGGSLYGILDESQDNSQQDDLNSQS